MHQWNTYAKLIRSAPMYPISYLQIVRLPLARSADAFLPLPEMCGCASAPEICYSSLQRLKGRHCWIDPRRRNWRPETRITFFTPILSEPIERDRSISRHTHAFAIQTHHHPPDDRSRCGRRRLHRSLEATASLVTALQSERIGYDWP